MPNEKRLPRRFLFHAEAVAYGARIDAPRLREVKAAIALPSIGGNAHAHANAHDPQALVRFDYAVSSVSGERRGKAYETRAACTLEGVEVAGVLRADVLAAVLTSRYVDGHSFHEESVTVKGLTVNGQAYEVDASALNGVRKCPTLATLKATLARDPGLAATFLKTGGPANAKGQPVETSSGELACFLLEPRLGQKPASLQFEAKGRKFQIVLGEYMIGERERRLTLLRVVLGPATLPPPSRPPKGGAAPMMLTKEGEPPSDDSLVFAEMRINGSTYP
jgi:hypothetical protein